MLEPKNISRLAQVMALLGVSAQRLSAACGISNSLISRWQKGARPLSAKSKALAPLAKALLALDAEGKLDEELASWRTSGESQQQALMAYLTGEDLPALPARAAPPALQRSGAYVIQQQVLLGEKGFRRATLLMLDYVMTLPPGRQVVVCAHNGFDLWLKNVPFALQFLQKLNTATKRGTTFLLVNRRGFGMENSAHFARFWLVAHLRGIIRSRYYKGEAPAEYFVASIRDYWSGHAETDDTAEDGLITTLYTDPRSIRRDEAHCDAQIARSAPASQYGFLRKPQGDKENARGWQKGPLPHWQQENAPAPAGNFSAICRVPCFGVMTRDEFEQVAGDDTARMLGKLPDYLFSDTGQFAPGPHRVILCREDVQEALATARRQSEPLSEVLHRRAFVPRDMLAAQVKRLLTAMERRADFELALVPRSAFAKLELEIVCWQNSASVGWLQDMSESVFANDAITSGSFAAAVNHSWDKLQKGWKRKLNVGRTLRKWLAGKELDTVFEDSKIVENWDVMP